MIPRFVIKGLRQVNAARYAAVRTHRPTIARDRIVLRGQPFVSARQYSGKETIDEIIEEIQDQYATAKDEFEIAMEETEKQTVYAEDDRKAAREELDKLHEQYAAVVNGPDHSMGEEIQRRIGQRIRELDAAVKNMEELAQNQD